MNSNNKKGNGRTGAQQSISAMERLSRTQIESRFAFQSLNAGNRHELPEVEIPEIGSIHVAVRLPMYADENELETELKERLTELQVQNAHRIERKPGEQLKQGDRVFVDIVTYMDGQIATFGCHENLPLFLEPGTLVPGFAEEMVSRSVGSRVILLSAFPEDYPEPSLRGKKFSMSIFVRAAEELQFPDETVQANSEQIQKTLNEILEEHGLQYRLKALNLALEKLAENAMTAVSENLLDAALKGEWFRKQGKFLFTQQVPQEDREDAMQQWLKNPELREEMRKRLAVTLAVRTVAQKYGLLNPSKQEFQNYLNGICQQMGFGFEQLNDSLSMDHETRNALYEEFIYTRAVDYVADNIRMEFQTI